MGKPSIDARNVPQESSPTPCVHTVCSAETGEENGIETVATNATISGPRLITNMPRVGDRLITYWLSHGALVAVFAGKELLDFVLGHAPSAKFGQRLFAEFLHPPLDFIVACGLSIHPPIMGRTARFSRSPLWRAAARKTETVDVRRCSWVGL
jgi:hypothetical protein